MTFSTQEVSRLSLTELAKLQRLVANEITRRLTGKPTQRKRPEPELISIGLNQDDRPDWTRF